MDTQARGSRRESGEENLRVLFMFRCARRVVGCVEDRDGAFNGGGGDNKIGRGFQKKKKTQIFAHEGGKVKHRLLMIGDVCLFFL